MLCAHLDVVPVEREKWSVDPFSGHIKDGYLYGRGTIDVKDSLMVCVLVSFCSSHHVHEKHDTDILQNQRCERTFTFFLLTVYGTSVTVSVTCICHARLNNILRRKIVVRKIVVRKIEILLSDRSEKRVERKIKFVKNTKNKCSLVLFEVSWRISFRG